VGEIEKPLVIGKAAKPRCFKNLKSNNLPVIWRNHKKACMSAATMEEWLNMFNAKMKKENINAILFLDNATCHPNVTHSNVKIAWFPANGTSVLQPMDVGVIYTFKLHYRQFLMQALIANIEEADSSCVLARSVSVLDAVNWTGLAVKKVKAETVTKYFAKAGFGESDVAKNLVEASKTLLQYLIAAEKKNFPVIQMALFGVMTI
jgi:hypothetical protein